MSSHRWHTSPNFFLTFSFHGFRCFFNICRYCWSMLQFSVCTFKGEPTCKELLSYSKPADRFTVTVIQSGRPVGISEPNRVRGVFSYQTLLCWMIFIFPWLKLHHSSVWRVTYRQKYNRCIKPESFLLATQSSSCCRICRFYIRRSVLAGLCFFFRVNEL